MFCILEYFKACFVDFKQIQHVIFFFVLQNQNAFNCKFPLSSFTRSKSLTQPEKLSIICASVYAKITII